MNQSEKKDKTDVRFSHDVIYRQAALLVAIVTASCC